MLTLITLLKSLGYLKFQFRKVVLFFTTVLQHNLSNVYIRFRVLYKHLSVFKKTIPKLE